MLEKFIESTFENSPSFMYVKDINGKYTRVNRQFEIVFNRSREDVIGKSDDELFERQTAENFRRSELEVIQTKKLVQSEKHVHLADGNHYFVTTKFPLFDENNKVYATCSIATDSTQEKLGKEALTKAAEAAERASQIKSEFLANMSHEIRTPMNAIMGMAELLSESTVNEEQKRFIDTLRKASENLLAIIDDVLDISKIEAGHLKLDYTDYNLRALVEDLSKALEPRAQLKGLNYSCQVDPNVADSFNGDPYRVRQVLMNLVNNALKFTSKGEIRLTVAANTEKSKRGNLLFAVSDTGVGISPEEQKKLFQYFHQADASVTKKFGGTGLGLAICKRLVAMMDGEIWLKSIPGAGTTFYFTLSSPRGLGVKEQKAAAATVKDVQPIKILLVDDSEDNRMLIITFLKKSGHTIIESDNGQDAVNKAKEGNIDLIFMDMQMPVLDGYNATRIIREWEVETNRPPVPIIALTAYALKEEEDKTYAAGCNRHISKPVSKQKVLDVIAEFSKIKKTAA